MKGMAVSEVQHTPGPWEATAISGTLKIVGPAGVKRYKQREICRIYGANRANVSLLEAAPKLLAVLEQLVADWDAVSESIQVPDEINDDTHWTAAREAIAEARGHTVE